MSDKIEALLQKEHGLYLLEKELFAKHAELQERSKTIRTLLLQYINLLIAERNELVSQMKFRDELAEVTRTRTRAQTSSETLTAPVTRSRNVKDNKKQ